MSIVMIKKVLADGSPCAKCAQVEDILKKRNLWDKIDRIVVAEEANPDSEGMKLAAERDISFAPFFLVDDQRGERVYTRVFEFIKKELDAAPLSTKDEAVPAYDVEEASRRLADATAYAIMKDAQEHFGEKLVLAFSGAEDVVLIDIASKNGLPFRVFCLDTGRLHGETYRYIDKVRDHYGIEIEIFTPSPSLLEPFVAEKGLMSFYRDGHQQCCSIRKVEPLDRALKSRLAWATGQRRDQSPTTRGELSVVESDQGHLNVQGRALVKFNPLIDWSSQKVWDYIRANEVPYNPLHDRGYVSIGCEPCTRPLRPGEHERAARWWWEEGTKRECGLHVKKS